MMTTAEIPTNAANEPSIGVSLAVAPVPCKSTVERVAAAVVGTVLLVLGAYLGYQSIQAIVGGSAHETSIPAIVLLVASAILLPPLGIAKRRVADRLASGALRGDSVLTLVAGLL